MQRFQSVSRLTGWIVLFAIITIAIAPSLVQSNTVDAFSITLVEVSETARLPTWLQRLNLSEAQIRQVFEIDAVLEQRLESILTSQQYSQWQSSQINLSDDAQGEPWTFEDLSIELSPYQQAAVDASFQSALQNLVDILSVEQRQQLREYLLEDETPTTLLRTEN